MALHVIEKEVKENTKYLSVSVCCMRSACIFTLFVKTGNTCPDMVSEPLQSIL